MTMLCLTLAGCGDVEWFPDPKSVPGDTSTLNVAPFTIPSKTNVTAGGTQTSDAVTITMTGGPASISVSAGGSYKINDNAFTTEAGTISNGQRVTVQHNHPAGVVQVVTTLTIGEESATFVSTTAAATDNVTQFTIAPKTSFTAEPVVSDPITVAVNGPNAVAISVVNGQFSINSESAADFGSTARTVTNGAQVRVRRPTTTTGQSVATLTIGDKSATFVSSIVTIEPFSFTAVSNAPLNSLVSSNVVTLRISGGTAPISITAEESSQYQINGGDFTADPGLVKDGDQIRVRHRTRSVGGAQHAVNTTLTVGNRSATFTSISGS